MSTRRISQQLLTCVLSVVIFYGLLGTEVQCTPAQARPSLESLQAQIDDLHSQVLHVVDGDGVAVGVFAGREQPAFGGPLTLNAYISEVGAVARFTAIRGELAPYDEPTFFFESTDCTGLAFSDEPARVFRPNVGPNTVYVLTGTESTLVTYRSYARSPILFTDVVCNTSTDSVNLVPATVIDPATDLGFASYPLPAPMYVAQLPSAP